MWSVIRPVWIMRKRWREMQRQTEQFYKRQKQAQQPEPRRKAKKIDPTVGEYVEFTEQVVSTTESTTSDAHTTVQTESQITDITWEDLPEK